MAPGKQRTILIVDDEQEICSLLSRHFRPAGFDVLTARDGEEALERLGEAFIDVVISDIKMPRMDGIELLRKIRADFPMTHVIMMTGYVTQENILCCIRLGADTCVFKPFEDFKELDAGVKRSVDALQNWWQKLIQLHQMRPAALPPKGESDHE